MKLINFSEHSLNNKIGIIFFILSIFALFIVLFSINTSIWVDEAFSLMMIQLSFLDMLYLLRFDVHPFLYYILLKFFITIISYLFHMNIIIVAKLFSTIPFIFLLLFASTRIRKYFDWLFAGLFSFCVISMPQMMHYAIEIRMYSWAMFFVFLCFLYSYEITLKSNLKNWSLFIIFGILAAYTHYYAMLAVGIIYLLFAYYLFKNNFNEWNKYLLSILISVLSYLWNLDILIFQFLKVKNDFWISNINLSIFIKDILYIVSPHNYYLLNTDLMSIITSINLDIFGILLLLTYFMLIVIYLKNNNQTFLLYSNLILILTIMVGIAVSIVVKPVFIARYMIPSLTCFWLTFAFLLSKTSDKKIIFIFTLLLILIIGAVSTYSFVLTEQQEYINDIKLINFVSKLSPNENIILKDVNDGLTLNLINYYFPNNCNMICSEKIDTWLSNKKIWVFGEKGYMYLSENYSLERKAIFRKDFVNIPYIKL